MLTAVGLLEGIDLGTAPCGHAPYRLGHGRVFRPSSTRSILQRKSTGRSGRPACPDQLRFSDDQTLPKEKPGGSNGMSNRNGNGETASKKRSDNLQFVY